ncbi:MAG: hypothetical protein ACJ79K_04420 [Gemmatimonadaceae bacterium]
MASIALVRGEGAPGNAPGDGPAGPSPAWRAGRWQSRTRYAAVALTVVLVLGAIWRKSPVEALGAGATAGGVGATLRLPTAYTLLSPFCELYDGLTLLTLKQHAALLAWLIAVFAMLRVSWHVDGWKRSVRRRGVHVDGMLLFAALASFVLVYVIGALVPRPMAGLVLDDPDELAVDVHSHTAASHDGRPGFDAAANRRWHAGAGFAAAYVTDHRHFEGAEAGERGNPRRAGDGTVLLSGIESAGPAGSRLTILGARASTELDHNGRADMVRLASDTSLVVVLTTPASLARVPATMPLDAVESADGAPLGLLFTRRLAPEIDRFATTRSVARVAGSNNHGWGRTASAWTVLRIPRWRELSPSSLDSAIRMTIRHDHGAVRVVTRGSTPLARSNEALIATPILLLWSITTRLSTAERVSWLAWIWSIVALLALAAALRSRRAERAWPPNGGASSAGRARRSPARARRAALRGR